MYTRAGKHGKSEKLKSRVSRVSLPTNGRFSGQIVGSLVMAEYEMEIEEVECSFHNMSLKGMCTPFGVFDGVHSDCAFRVCSNNYSKSF